MTDITERLERLYVQHGTNYVQEAAEEIRRLRSEVEALRKDAARYRWLRHNSGFSIAENLFGAQSMRGFRDAHLDDAIDAEITAQAITATESPSPSSPC